MEKHLDYGQGECIGEVSQDSVSIGDLEDPVTQTFVLVKAQEDLTPMVTDGLLVGFMQGMAFSSLSDNYPTLVESLAASGMIESSSFLLHLSSKSSTGAYMELGVTSMSQSSESVYLSQPSTYWNVPLTQVKIGSSSVPFPHTRTAILNSGYSKLGIPTEDYQSVLTMLASTFENCGQYIVCTNATHFPDITLQLASSTFSISRDYFLFPLDMEEGEGLHALLIEAVDVTVNGEKAWVLGDVFLRAHDVLFDMANMQVVIERDRSDSSSSSSFPIWVIILIAVVGGVLFMIGSVVVIYCVWRRKRQSGPAFVPLRPPNSPAALQPMSYAPDYQYPPPLYPPAMSPNYPPPSAPVLPPSPNLYPSFE